MLFSIMSFKSLANPDLININHQESFLFDISYCFLVKIMSEFVFVAKDALNRFFLSHPRTLGQLLLPLLLRLLQLETYLRSFSFLLKAGSGYKS